MPVRLRLFWLDVLALLGAVCALAPLLARRHPRGARAPAPAAEVVVLARSASPP